MTDGWKLGVLKRRRDYLRGRIALADEAGVTASRDRREAEALEWAVERLEAS